ncbi:hypothetical protein ACFHW2_02700 [Actinomadura sp. LOL_016]|uniref:hypothetical protein n=1 Tax=unclassified Actinomadura TaxID=2626254 RepID=UPI003A7FEEAB
MLHLGDGTVIAGEPLGAGREYRLVRCADGGTRTLHTALGSVPAVVSIGGGRFAAATRTGELIVGGRDGVHEVRRLSGYGLRGHVVPRFGTSRPASGRVAIVDGALHLLDPSCPDAVTVRAETSGGRRAVLELLHACLEHRFRFDVEVGEAARLPAGDHDIGL